jgi:hypothetical protein
LGTILHAAPWLLQRLERALQRCARARATEHASLLARGATLERWVRWAARSWAAR